MAGTVRVVARSCLTAWYAASMAASRSARSPVCQNRVIREAPRADRNLATLGWSGGVASTAWRSAPMAASRSRGPHTLQTGHAVNGQGWSGRWRGAGARVWWRPRPGARR